MKSFEPLTRDEESRLHASMRSGDRAARERLIEACWWWAYRTVQRTAGKRFDMGECQSLASLGAIHGVDAFDPARGMLSTAVYWHAKKAVLDAMRKRGLIRVPPHALKEGFRFLKNAECALHIATIGTRTGLADRREYNHDFLLDQEERWLSVQRAITGLTPRERAAITNMLDGLTLQEGGMVRGVTREAERQARHSAIRRLRTILVKSTA